MAANGNRIDVTLLADTGNPFAIVLSPATIGRLKRRAAPSVNSNFGLLEGRWLRLFMPEFEIDHKVVGYASDALASATKKSHPDFEGLVGLPFLRMFEFGGNADSFWLRRAI